MPLSRIRMPATFALALLLLGCSETTTLSSSGRFLPDKAVPSSAFTQRTALALQSESEGSSGALQPGTGQFLNPATATRQASKALAIPSGNKMVELELVDASVPAAAKAILGDALGLNYTVSDAVTGRVTLRTTGPIPRTAVLDLFEAALAANGAKLEQNGQIVKVVPGTSGARSFRRADGSAIRGGEILVAPLKYVSAEEMVGLLEPLVADGLSIIPDRQRNLLLLIGAPSLQEAALDALNLFDVDVMRGKTVALVRLRSAEPSAIVDELRTIFETEEGGMLQGVVEFVPNQRLGSVLIISSRADYVDRARRWIKELDLNAAGTSVYLQTYQLKNRTAREIAPILDRLLASSASDATQTASVAGEGSAGVEEASSVVTSSDSRSARVVADEERNALIVRAKRSEHDEIQAVLQELDQPARQVLLEATIAEVTLNNALDVGVRWFLESDGVALRFSDLTSGAVGGVFPGFSAIFGDGGAKVALSALSSVTDVKVISSPTLVVVDNKQGTLQIGDQVPVATQTAGQLTQDTLVLTQVEYRDTGIILTVLPHIGNGGRISLDITQEVSDVSSTRTSGIDSPTISQRRVQTSVVLYDGQTLMLGGLVRENDNEVRSEVPGIGQVPVVGALFRKKNSTRERTELLVLIRPRIINDEGTARSITAEWRSQLRKADSILQTGLGSPRHSFRDAVR